MKAHKSRIKFHNHNLCPGVDAEFSSMGGQLFTNYNYMIFNLILHYFISMGVENFDIKYRARLYVTKFLNLCLKNQYKLSIFKKYGGQWTSTCSI
jgi:hypothetical protein